jgi:hypothetical protein
MGCDIHAYIDYDIPRTARTPCDDEEVYVSNAFHSRLSISRHYDLFGLIAGVRGGTAIFPRRGVPAAISYTVKGDLVLYVEDKISDEDGFCSMADAKRWVKQAEGPHEGWYEEGVSVYHPDWHSHTWLTCPELKQVIDAFDEELVQYEKEMREEDARLLENLNKEADSDYKKTMLTYFTAPANYRPDSAEVDIKNIYCVMQNLEQFGYTTRFVCWFDN